MEPGYLSAIARVRQIRADIGSLHSATSRMFQNMLSQSIGSAESTAVEKSAGTGSTEAQEAQAEKGNVSAFAVQTPNIKQAADNADGAITQGSEEKAVNEGKAPITLAAVPQEDTEAAAQAGAAQAEAAGRPEEEGAGEESAQTSAPGHVVKDEDKQAADEPVEAEGLEEEALRTVVPPAGQGVSTPEENLAVQAVQTQDRRTRYDDYIAEASQAYGIPAELIKGVIQAESNFNNGDVSHAGAGGLMQLMPGTAKYLGVKDRFDPYQNIMGGTKYLREMLDKFGGNVYLALSAYNMGPGALSRYGIDPANATSSDYERLSNLSYVKKVLRYAEAY